jgi:hypothetical protein
MKRHILAAFGIAVAVCGVAAHAHHSIAGVYDGSRQVTIDGVIAQFQFINPHPFVVIDVKDENGRAQQWTAEMDNRRELVEVGFDSGTLRPGDRVVVTGSPSRAQRQTLYIRRLERPADGFNYEQIGNSPSIGRTSRPRD